MVVTPAELEEAFDGARRRGQVHRPLLEWRLEKLRRSGRPGVAGLDRRSSGSTRADAERRARLVAMGLRVVDFTYEDVTERPQHVVDTLARLLGLEPW